MDRIDLGIALAISGGYSRYQRRLVLFLLPITTSGVFCANAVTFVLPAIVCDLQISKYRQGLLYSAVFIGMVIGGFVWGVVADTVGRRRTLIIILGFTAALEFLSSFTASYWSLFFCKFCAGFTNCGILTTFFTYSSEFVDGKNKDKMTMCIGGATALGYFIQPMIAVFTLPLKFNYAIIHNAIYLNSWKLFVIISAFIPFFGFLIALFVLHESPAFLIRSNRQEEALKLVQQIYSFNTGNPPESFPVKGLYLKEDEEKMKEEKQFLERGVKVNLIVKTVSLIKPLFRYPFLIPALMAFASQFITMTTYNSIRSHQSTVFSMALGIGQNQSMVNETDAETISFCKLFETQHIFQQNIRCEQDSINLNPKIYVCSSIIGFCIFLSFIPASVAVNKFGKKWNKICLNKI